jgi:haloalkane dehalogenase
MDGCGERRWDRLATTGLTQLVREQEHDEMTSTLLKDWSDKGEHLDVPDSAATRIWREGSGPPVVCLHGVPSSAYLYRKVLPELAGRGFEGVALDIQGLGFSERPVDFDYSWTGLSGWLKRALAAAGIDKFHLVVHDLGGPIGFDLIRRDPDRILSLTVLNTLVDVSTFKKPLVMRPFTVPVLGRLMTLSMNSPGVYGFFRWKGVDAGPTYAEIRVYGELLVRGDGGRAFQQIMASFEQTSEFEQRIIEPLRDRSFPAQIVWSRGDSELTVDPYALSIKRALGLDTDVHMVAGKHFLQENSYVEIAQRVAELAAAGADI